MYCAICECEYKGWYGKCPNCKNPLLNEPHLDPLSSDEQISYERLVEIIRENGGALEVDLATIEVNKSKSFRFPWLGYGYAWAKRMRGASQGITVDFYTIEVGKDRKFAFPYLGHGYAWGKTIQGSLAGNEATLKAKKVNRKRGWNFPYFGYSYAWTEVMSGSCGEKLNLELITTKVGKNHRMRFPYFGFGYAWVDQAKITISLN